MKIGKINVGRSTKRYTHDLSHDVNTTASWGIVQPLLCQYMSPKDSINVRVKQLLRLAPLPVPTHSRISVVNRAVFVPISDVHRSFEALLSEQMVKSSNLSYIPQSLPFTNSALLVAFMLSRSGITPHKFTARITHTGGDLTPNSFGIDGTIDIDSAFGSASNCWNVYVASLEKLGVNIKTLLAPNVGVKSTPSDYDFIFFKQDADSTSSSPCFCSKLNLKYRQLHRLLKSLGYSLSLYDTTRVSILPLLAWYKAWFDVYAPKRSVNWHSTNAFKLIDLIFESDVSDFAGSVPASDSSVKARYNLFFEFLDDLCNCFYSDLPDYMTVHTQNLTNISDEAIRDTGFDPLNISSVVSLSGLPVLNDQIYGNGTLSNITLQLLQRMTRFVNKNSIIGKRVEDYVRVHYGADFVSTLFSDSSDLGSFITNADISDVISQSDTDLSGDGSGELLGAYAGRGIGFSDGNLSYTSSTFGYFFILTSVVPKSGYSQGNDPSLYALGRYSLPSADFDALGYEATPMSTFFDDNGISATELKMMEFHKRIFGFVPRFSGFKVKKNVISGSFALNSLRANYESYHLDKYFIHNKVDYSPATKAIVVSGYHPSAVSEEYRYVGKYPNYGFFNRIFYNQGSSLESFNSESENKVQPMEDNFIIQNVLDVRLTNELKPIRESYDVFQGDTDNSSVSLTSV